MEIETPVLLAYAIEDSTDIFRISGGGGLNNPNPPFRYATGVEQYTEAFTPQLSVYGHSK